jgi:hypothetical protein
MASSQSWPCNACAYWQPYPSWEGVGTCDDTLSRSYARMAVGTGEHCEYAESYTGPGDREPSEPLGPTPGGTTCENCHYWYPFGTMPRVGECDNPSSGHFRSPEFSDKPTEACYVKRSLDGLEFMWCQTHRQTIHSTDLPLHGKCSVYVSSVSLPVEEQMELTVAGD